MVKTERTSYEILRDSTVSGASSITGSTINKFEEKPSSAVEALRGHTYITPIDAHYVDISFFSTFKLFNIAGTVLIGLGFAMLGFVGSFYTVNNSIWIVFLFISIILIVLGIIFDIIAYITIQKKMTEKKVELNR